MGVKASTYELGGYSSDHNNDNDKYLFNASYVLGLKLSVLYRLMYLIYIITVGKRLYSSFDIEENRFRESET